MRLGREVARLFAETMLYWRGHLSAEEIQRFARVSERTARSMLSDWKHLGFLPAHWPSRARRPTSIEDFDPGERVSDPGIAFDLMMTAEHCPGSPFATVAARDGAHDLTLSATVPRGPTRMIIGACLDGMALRLVYAAKTGRQEVTFSPSAVVRSRGRYHVRGHRADGRDSLRNVLADRYVDLVPARAVDAWFVEAPFVGLDDDEEWNAFEEQNFRLSPELDEDERLCYEHEYGISETGVLWVRQRRALIKYIRQELSERFCWRPDGTRVPIWELVTEGPVDVD